MARPGNEGNEVILKAYVHEMVCGSSGLEQEYKSYKWSFKRDIN